MPMTRAGAEQRLTHHVPGVAGIFGQSPRRSRPTVRRVGLSAQAMLRRSRQPPRRDCIWVLRKGERPRIGIAQHNRNWPISRRLPGPHTGPCRAVCTTSGMNRRRAIQPRLAPVFCFAHGNPHGTLFADMQPGRALTASMPKTASVRWPNTDAHQHRHCSPSGDWR